MSRLRDQLAELWTRLRSSYWFIPSLMTLAAVFLSAYVVSMDERLGAEWARQLDWLRQDQPEGARAVLATVAGSMITVAGVTFSMTLLAVSHASSQMGPRILSGFMRDKGNQFTLGTFIATFVYCLLVLRTVRGSGSGGEVAAFVPRLGVLLAMALALASVAVLIYFVHHVPQTINVTNVIDRTGNELLRQIDELFPTKIGSERDAAAGDSAAAEEREAPPREAGGAGPQPPAGFVDEGELLLAPGRGYLRRVDGDSLLRLAQREGLVVEQLCRPGDYVGPRTAMLRAWPATRLDDEIRAELRALFSLGAQRSPVQDVMLPVDQLIEMAVRALSPGINDPFTAIECIEQLEQGLIELSRRETPAAARFDDEGTLRVIAHPHRFVDVLDRTFDVLRGYGLEDVLIGLRMLGVLERLGEHVVDREDRERLATHGLAIAAGGRAALGDVRDADRLDEAFERAGEALGVR